MSLHGRSDTLIAVMSFYILFYEDQLHPGVQYSSREYQVFQNRSFAPPLRDPDRSMKRDPRCAFRDPPSYPLALKAARHLIAVIFHRAPGRI